MRSARTVVSLTLALLVLLAGATGGVGATAGEDEGGELSVHFIHTDAGVSTLVVGPTGETLLYDTADHGGTDDVIAYLREQDVDHVDHLVASHAHGDHIAGHPQVIERGVGTAYDSGIDRGTPAYRAYLDALDSHDVPRERLRAGDSIPLDGVEVTVLSPPDRALEPGSTNVYNENSLVLRVEFGETSVLLTGDAGESAERYLLEEHAEAIDVTVLQVSKEGSSDSTTDAFLDAVTPAAAVIDGGDHDTPDRPHESVLERLDERDVPTYWNAVHGDTVVRTDGERTTVATQRDAPTDPDDLRDAPPVSPALDRTPEQVDVVYDANGDSGEDRDTQTPTPTPTQTDTPTPTPTDTPTQTDTPTPTPTDTPTSTPTPTPTETPTPAPTPTQTDTPTPTPTPTQTDTPTPNGTDGTDVPAGGVTNPPPGFGVPGEVPMFAIIVAGLVAVVFLARR